MPVNYIVIPQINTANYASGSRPAPAAYVADSKPVPDYSKADGQPGTGSNLIFLRESTPVPNPNKADGRLGTGSNITFIARSTQVPNFARADGKVGTGSNATSLLGTTTRITYIPNPIGTDNTDGTFSSIPAIPAIGAVTAIGEFGFTGNWLASALATDYKLDVSTDPNFGSFVAGYNNKSVGAFLSAQVSGLVQRTTYYFRVRASNPIGSSGNSAVGSILTLPPVLVLTYQQIFEPDLAQYEARLNWTWDGPTDPPAWLVQVFIDGSWIDGAAMSGSFRGPSFTLTVPNTFRLVEADAFNQYIPGGVISNSVNIPANPPSPF